MIIFDLRCASGGHVFESWFGSSGDYDDQQARGLVTCPICGDGEVGKAPMAPAVPNKAGNRAAPPDLFSSAPWEVKAMLGAMAALQRQMLAKSDWVGDRFANEARAIHFGESDSRLIHGQASCAEAASLIEDGVPVAPLLFPVPSPGEEN